MVPKSKPSRVSGNRRGRSNGGWARDGLSLNRMTQDLAHRIARQGLDKVDAGSVEPAELSIERNSQPFRVDRRRGFNNDMDFLLAAVVLRGKQADAADAK